jgi:hypothetical protein
MVFEEWEIGMIRKMKECLINRPVAFRTIPRFWHPHTGITAFLLLLRAPGLFVLEGEKWKLGSERPKTQVPKGGTWSTRRTTIRVGRNEPSVVQKDHSIA